MHELAVCQALLNQVETIAKREGAAQVTIIRIQIGPLAGVVAELLEQAFTVARAGTVAADARLVVTRKPVRVLCESCGAETDASANRLLCGVCGDYHTRLISGDELMLTQVELECEECAHV